MNDEFLDMQKEAKELVSGLKKLNEEVKTYKTSKEQLQDINKTLTGFIDETKKLTEKSAKIFENVANISPTKIDKKVDEISKRIDKFEEVINKTIERMERTESSLANQMKLLTKEVERNSETIANNNYIIEEKLKGKGGFFSRKN